MLVTIDQLKESDCADVKALVSDVDGVLTDGRLFMHGPGEWRRYFHIQDGLGLKQAVQSGMHVALITGSEAQDIADRAAMLSIKWVFQGVQTKLPVLEKFLSEQNLTLKQCAYVGDDLPDLPVLEKVGLPIIVPNAHKDLLQNPKFFRTISRGGEGAIREVTDTILKARRK